MSNNIILLVFERADCYSTSIGRYYYKTRIMCTYAYVIIDLLFTYLLQVPVRSVKLVSELIIFNYLFLII